MNEAETAQVELYQSQDGSIALEVRADAETVWLTRHQMASLFGRDVKTIGKHIANARREELDGIPTVAKFATVQREGDRLVERTVEHYNLDAVLSVGYRVKSAEGIHFRRWANAVLKRYMLEGAALNERRLEQLGSIVRVLSRSSDELVAGVADVLAGYLPGLRALRDYDEGTITSPAGDAPSWVLNYDEARSVIARIAAEFPDDRLFGRERGDGLKSVVDAVYQTFGGQQLYPTVQDQAANLLYLVVKDHPLSDGNKRSAAALFVHFLAKNGALHDHRGLPRISNNALAAITLMVAMSDPKEKELMVALVMRMLSEE
ncbi:virulence protein RhuM/Fic/DOC family protein [Agromyces sp. H66]|uniref:virulence protein RhuM/Fic/DOC family protein n=1 Tax=Agromyces sp. H66 TaxID=2529859 RepID=UPI0020BE945E|nr:virulence protein RhuM/Fic/DOC family protein [Agromyces sp. H66]